MPMIAKLLVFLVLNFGALALGVVLMGGGVMSDWYSHLNKAPWTPPGWFFGFAWTSIMICFAFYMTLLWSKAQNKGQLAVLFSFQWILNVGWNPAFFYFRQTTLALALITLLTFLIGFLIYFYWKNLKLKSVLLFPYFIWLVIATSLNAYIVLKN